NRLEYALIPPLAGACIRLQPELVSPPAWLLPPHTVRGRRVHPSRAALRFSRRGPAHAVTSGDGPMTAILPATNEQAERVVAGILIALSGNIMFATSDAMVKLLTARYSVFQIIVSQALFALIPLTVMILRKGNFRNLRI